LLDLPEPDRPLDVLCLLLCQLAGRSIDIGEQRALLDQAATGLPADFAGAMAHLFQGPASFRANETDYYDLANSLLSEVWRRRLGIPITLSVVAIELGRRAGVPIVGVGMPGHFLVASRD